MNLLLRAATLAAVAGMMASAGSAHAARAYIGTYTPNLADPTAYASGTGEGIYLVNVDDATGALSGLTLAFVMFAPMVLGHALLVPTFLMQTFVNLERDSRWRWPTSRR